VSRPPRSSAGPVLVLLLAALVPALALWSAWQWADGKAEAFDVPPPTSTTVVPLPAPAPALATPIGSLRRAPAALARELNLDAFRNDLAPLLDAVNDRSCVSVSVDGVDVGARNDRISVLPASVQKIVVAAVALEVLGAEHRYTTRVVGPSPVDGVVSGDLVLVGGGDPLLAGDWYPASNLERFPLFNHTSLDQLADTVVGAGVTRVTGAVLGDGSRYDDEFAAPGWGLGVAGLEAGPYGALMVNDARVLGDDLRASEPAQAAAREFVRLLTERGVTVDGPPGVGRAAEGGKDLGTIASVALPDVIEEMLTNSDNNTAEMMVKEIGFVGGGTGTRVAGLAVMASTLEAWGIDLADVVLTDGSGLSLDNSMTCAALLAILQRAGDDSPVGRALPLASTTGTLSGAFADGPVAGRLLGKTGTLNNPPFNEDPPAVKALAGYLPVVGGGTVEYVLLLNGPTISDQSEYRPIWNLLAATLASYPAAAGPAELGPR
jgi:serine-type D-Ala-D-Ala carboxypeptidase/endopeptidase (penicillin-binding protein 4)